MSPGAARKTSIKTMDLPSPILGDQRPSKQVKTMLGLHFLSTKTRRLEFLKPLPSICDTTLVQQISECKLTVCTSLLSKVASSSSDLTPTEEYQKFIEGKIVRAPNSSYTGALAASSIQSPQERQQE
jgi:hypothetical protein